MKVVFATALGFVFLFLSIGRAAAASSIVINEVLPNPLEGGTEWVELFNPTDQPIDISSWSIVDKAGTSPPTTSGMIAPNGVFLIVERGEGWLNNSGYESVTLKDSSGTVIDAMAYGSGSDPVLSVGSTPGDGKSIGRQGDGGSSWAIFDPPSKGGSNPTPTPEPTASPPPSPMPTPSPTLTPTPASVRYSTAPDSGEAKSKPSPSLPPALALLPTPRSTPRSQEILGTKSASPSSKTSPSPSSSVASSNEKKGPPWFVFLIPPLLLAGVGCVILGGWKLGLFPWGVGHGTIRT